MPKNKSSKRKKSRATNEFSAWKNSYILNKKYPSSSILPSNVCMLRSADSFPYLPGKLAMVCDPNTCQVH